MELCLTAKMMHLAHTPRRQLAGQYRSICFWQWIDRQLISCDRLKKAAPPGAFSSSNEAESVAEFCVPTSKALLTNT